MLLTSYHTPEATLTELLAKDNLLTLSDFGQNGQAGSGFDSNDQIIDIPESF